LNYLSAVLTPSQPTQAQPDRLLLRLTLKGNFIWSTEALSLFKKGTPGGYLDGEAFRAPRDFDAHEIVLPSGDGRRGGDLEMWFWLAPQPEAKTSDKVTDVKMSTPGQRCQDVRCQGDGCQAVGRQGYGGQGL